MDKLTIAELKAAAQSLGSAAETAGFMPAGLRNSLELAAQFAAGSAAHIEDLTERLSNEAATNAAILARIGELQEQVEALTK